MVLDKNIRISVVFILSVFSNGSVSGGYQAAIGANIGYNETPCIMYMYVDILKPSQDFSLTVSCL